MKTHVDIVGDFDRKGWKELRELAAKQCVWYAGIGSINTVKAQSGVDNG